MKIGFKLKRCVEMSDDLTAEEELQMRSILRRALSARAGVGVALTNLGQSQFGGSGLNFPLHYEAVLPSESKGAGHNGGPQELPPGEAVADVLNEGSGRAFLGHDGYRISDTLASSWQGLGGRGTSVYFTIEAMESYGNGHRRSCMQAIV